MGWLRNRTIRSYTKKAVNYLYAEIEKLEKENPTLSLRDALKKIGTPLSWNLNGEATTDLDRFEDDFNLFQIVAFFLARQGLLVELNIFISTEEEFGLIHETSMKEIEKILQRRL